MQRDRTNAVTTGIEIPILVPARAKQGQGYDTFHSQLGKPSPVRVLRSEDFKSVFAGLSDDERNQFVELMGLIKALEEKDPVALRKQREKFAERRQARRRRKEPLDDRVGETVARVFGVTPKEALDWFYGLDLSGWEKKDPRWLLSREVSEAVEKVRLVLWWTGKRFLPALSSPDLASAFYIHALLHVARGKGFAVCPHCSSPFVRKRPDQQYCSIDHREAHRVARWRERKSQGSKRHRRS